jgi:hypothetical protein
LGSIKDGEFFDKLSDYKLLKKDYAMELVGHTRSSEHVISQGLFIPPPSPPKLHFFQKSL